jgi:hypothetical protein
MFGDVDGHEARRILRRMTEGWTAIAHARELRMPDLSALVAESGTSIVLLGFRNFLTGHGVPFIPGSHAHAHYKLFVRQVDKALRRYEDARAHLYDAINRRPDEAAIDSVVRAMSDLEDSVSAIHRESVCSRS